MIRRMLCATDGSMASGKAVDAAVEFARQLDAALTFITVERVTSQSAASSAFWDSKVLDVAAAQTHRDLSAAVSKAHAAGLSTVQCVTTQGTNIAAAIIDYAEKHGFDHIVTGSVGRTGLARLMLGSVAADIVTKAHCPVTVVR